jgi:hypothetical protein
VRLLRLFQMLLKPGNTSRRLQRNLQLPSTTR